MSFDILETNCRQALAGFTPNSEKEVDENVLYGACGEEAEHCDRLSGEEEKVCRFQTICSRHKSTVSCANETGAACGVS